MTVLLRGRTEGNLIEAVAAGAANAIPLVANILVTVIAFVALLHFINATLTWFGQRVGIEELTYQVKAWFHVQLLCAIFEQLLYSYFRRGFLCNCRMQFFACNALQ